LDQIDLSPLTSMMLKTAALAQPHICVPIRIKHQWQRIPARGVPGQQQGEQQQQQQQHDHQHQQQHQHQHQHQQQQLVEQQQQQQQQQQPRSQEQQQTKKEISWVSQNLRV
jgi:hypothetical protein